MTKPLLLAVFLNKHVLQKHFAKLPPKARKIFIVATLLNFSEKNLQRLEARYAWQIFSATPAPHSRRKG